MPRHRPDHLDGRFAAAPRASGHLPARLPWPLAVALIAGASLGLWAMVAVIAQALFA